VVRGASGARCDPYFHRLCERCRAVAGVGGAGNGWLAPFASRYFLLLAKASRPPVRPRNGRAAHDFAAGRGREGAGSEIIATRGSAFQMERTKARRKP
jgi:hypothetical protein